AMLAYLEHTASTWDIFDIDEQLTDPASAAMQAHFRRSGCLVAESSTLCHYIKPTGTWEQFMAARPKKLRSNINRLRRKISAMGEVRVRNVNSWPALKAALDTHCEIEERSWKAEQRLHLSCSKSHFF